MWIIIFFLIVYIFSFFWKYKKKKLPDIQKYLIHDVKKYYR